ncbi:hypothetical protein F2P81_018859 [Scophthalmus maximus]|uniref:Uncharacterized protein n=1 Tax=Scophthalmus maximus TaxID=52904 RepID=A0A6A4SFR4_SCOMX|nr:hypothetical protein F2P81_018859 [Scophthalmus maximus]
MSAVYKDDQEDWVTVCLKYLLFVFNFLFWVGGAAVLGVGVWTLVEKSDYLSLLASSTFAVSAYILILAGSLVVVTGFLGCCAVIREQRSCLSTYFFCLLFIFLIELVAGVLAYVYYQRSRVTHVSHEAAKVWFLIGSLVLIIGLFSPELPEQRNIPSAFVVNITRRRSSVRYRHLILVISQSGPSSPR